MLKEGSGQKTISQNIATEVRSGRDPKQAAAIAYAEARKSRDRSPSMMGSPMDPKGGQASNAPASAGDPSKVPGAGERDGSFSQVPGRNPGRSPQAMGSPFDPKDSSFNAGYSGNSPSRSMAVMGSPVDPDDATSSLPDHQGLPKDASLPTSRERPLDQPQPKTPSSGSGLDQAAMGGAAAVAHFAGGMERFASRDSRGLYPPMGNSARKMPGGQAGNG